MRFVPRSKEKRDEVDIVDQFFLEEANKKFQNFVKGLAEDLADGKISPPDAYNMFFRKTDEFFPQHVRNPELREKLIQRFQLYIQMCILSKSKK